MLHETNHWLKAGQEVHSTGERDAVVTVALDAPVLESLRSLPREGWTRRSKNRQSDLALQCYVAALRIWMILARLPADLLFNSPVKVQDPGMVLGAETLVVHIDLRKALAYVWDAELLAQGPDMTKTPLTALASSKSHAIYIYI